MKFNLILNKSLSFLVYSNLWISVGSALLCYQIFFLNNLKLDSNYLFFILFSTLFSYTIQRLFRIKQLEETTPNAWVVKNKKLAIVLALFSLILASYYLTQFFTLLIFLILIPTGLISFFYSFNKWRDIPFIKIFLISFSWGITAGILPFIINGIFNFHSILINFFIVFFYILAITIPFDIRDLNVDETNKKTIPQLFGVKKAKTIALASQITSLILFVFLFETKASLFYLASSSIAMLLILFSSSKKQDFYFSFGIDGHLVFQFLLIFFFA